LNETSRTRCWRICVSRVASQLRRVSFLCGQGGHASSLLATYRAELAAPFVEGEFTRGAPQLLQLRYVKVPRYLQRQSQIFLFFPLPTYPPPLPAFLSAISHIPRPRSRRVRLPIRCTCRDDRIRSRTRPSCWT